MGRDDKDKGTEEPSAALQQRATRAAQRARDLALAGFPSFDQLKARTDMFFARVVGKLAEVPAERLQPPPATIAAPAALQCALLGDADEVAELREMFENLLAASMDRATAAGAHPAFVSMISQLTPDEARILKSIDRESYMLFNVYEPGPDPRRWLAVRTQFGIGVSVDETQRRQYISNLDRLGILRIIDHSSADAAWIEDKIKVPIAEFPGRSVSIESIVVTPLGRQFLDTCVRARGQ